MSVSATVPSPLEWPFAGRDAELGALAAIVARRDTRGALLVGDAGTGKSRVAEDFARRWELDGGTTIRLVATASGREIPLGAVAHLLPRDVATFGTVDHELDRLRIFQAAEDACDALTQLPRALVVIDDIDLLDGLSAVLVCKQVEAGTARIIATMRSDSRPVDDIVRLRDKGTLVELELDALDRVAVEQILHQALGAVVDPATLATLGRTSQGNPLLLRELVTGARDRGDLRADDSGTWRLHRPLVGTRRVQDLVEERLSGLTDEARRALEALAVAGELPLHLLEDVVGPDALDHLEADGLISLRTDGNRALVRPAHPIHAEVVQARTGGLARRRLFGALADALRSRGARRREDPIRLAVWQLESGQGADVDLLVRAARVSTAFFDTEPAARLASAALDAGAGAPAALVLAEARSMQGRYQDVEDVLTRVEGEVGALDASDRARFASRRASNLIHGLGRHEQASAVLAAAFEPGLDDSTRRFLSAKVAVLDAVAGDVRAALAATDELVDDAELETRTQAGYARALALLHDGQVDAAIAVADRAYRDHLTLEGVPGSGHPASQLPAAVLARALAGRAAEGLAIVDEIQGSPTFRGTAVGLMVAHRLRAEVAMLAGDLVRADEEYRRALAARADMQSSWLDVTVLAGRGMASMWMGDADGAGADLATADGHEVALRGTRFERERLRAWLLVESGARTEGVDHLRATAAEAATLHDRWYETMLLHDCLVLGDTSVAARIDELGTPSDAALLAGLAAHARARATRDLGALVAAVDELERDGYLLHAMRVAHDGAALARAEGDQRLARALHRRAHTLAGRCTGIRLLDLGDGDAVEPLTPREREIATLAAQRRSNREIADQLYVSTRTVENHLAKVYEKLGIKGRRDLSAALEREP